MNLACWSEGKSLPYRCLSGSANVRASRPQEVRTIEFDEHEASCGPSVQERLLGLPYDASDDVDSSWEDWRIGD